MLLAPSIILAGLALLAAVVAVRAIKRSKDLEAKFMADKTALDAAVGRVVNSASGAVKRAADALSTKNDQTQDVDLSPEIQQLNDVATQLDQIAADATTAPTDSTPTDSTPADSTPVDATPTTPDTVV